MKPEDVETSILVDEVVWVHVGDVHPTLGPYDLWLWVALHVTGQLHCVADVGDELYLSLVDARWHCSNTTDR